MIKNKNNVLFSSFFQDRILDNNGISVTDINAGLKNLYVQYNDYKNKFTDSERYYVLEQEHGYPDLVAKNSILADQEYWWWVLLINNLVNPMTDIKSDWVYSIVDINQIGNFINNTNENISSNNNRLGKVVELN